MNRTMESMQSRETISRLKTIYVEGKLDYQIIDAILKNNMILNVNVVEINVEVDESNLPIEERNISKEKIVQLITKLNEDEYNQKYIGIIDLDMDFVNSCLHSIENLLYTDYSMIESYLLNSQLLTDFLNEYVSTESNICEEDLDIYINNMDEFSRYFLFQLNSIKRLSKEEIIAEKNKFIKFKELRLCHDFYIDKSTRKLNLDNILLGELKTNAEIQRASFSMFCTSLSLDAGEILKFVHGKYTLNYVLCNLKFTYFQKINKLGVDLIINILKDKFVLYNYYAQYPLFQSILQFAKT
ncbi:MAG TPA: hypothetical protein EYG89_05620 [Bacteroidia bacterium]|nr:hypothetical protein [Bacteroidia bacterium]